MIVRITAVRTEVTVWTASGPSAASVCLATGEVWELRSLCGQPRDLRLPLSARLQVRSENGVEFTVWTLDSLGTFSCVCQPGYRWGVRMEVTVWTASGPSAASVSLATGEGWEWRSLCGRPQDLQLSLSAWQQVRGENGGHCVDSLGTFICLCQPSYRWGVRMEVNILTSEPSPASVRQATGEGWAWRSLCGQPRDLPLPLSAWLQVRCENGCQYTDLGTFSCLCQPGFRWGVRIEVNILSSEPSAASVSLATGEGWERRSIYCPRNLQLPLSAWLQVRCENGGLCVDGLGTFSCLCQPGYR